MRKDIFIERARSVHGYKYKYNNLENKITLMDYIDIEFDGVIYKQRVNKHLIGKCPEKNTPKITKDEFISKSIEIWGDRFDYTETEYINSNSKIKFYDKINNRYVEQIASLHIRGFEAKKMDNESFILESKLLYDNMYSYDKCKYLNKSTKVKITCLEHGDFIINPFNHLNNGSGCTNCIDIKIKKKIAKFLDKNNISYYRQHKFPDCKNIFQLPFDFYLPKYRTVIEFDGKQHYEPIPHFGGLNTYNRLKVNDKIKSDYCEDNCIDLIRIRYDQIDRIFEILKESLKTKNFNN
jgi:hypothetical protein